MKQFKGFTLIELMMTLAILAILMSVALPSFISLNRSSNITSLSNSMLSSMLLARAEATKLRGTVAVCNAASATACGGSNQDWSNGWLVYSLGTSRTNMAYDATQNDKILALVEAETGITIKTNSAASQLVAFNRDGSSVSGSMASFGICDNRGADYGRQIQIQASGRPSVITPLDGVTCAP